MKPNNYKKKISWFKSRKLQLFCYLSDLVLILSIFYLFEKKYFFELNIINYLFVFLWLILGFILGRYFNPNDKNNNNLIRHLKSSIICYSFILSTKFFLISLFKNYNIESLINTNFTSIFSTLLFLSIILQMININIINKGLKNKIWLYLGSSETFKVIKNEINQKRYKKKVILQNSRDNLDSILSKGFTQYIGICVENINKLDTNQIKLLNDLNNKGLEVFELFDWCSIALDNYPPKILKAINCKLSTINYSKTSMDIRLKRIGDIFLSLLILIFSFPILLLACFLIKLEDNGPLFYSQARNGFKGKSFKIVKLRSMNINAEKNVAIWSSVNDKRITKIGNLLRKTRIDELPQLISVIKGDMSLIGPRPEREEFDKLLRKNIPYYEYRYNIKPGLSGWAQVNYPYGASISDSENKLSYDLFYLINFSFILDFLILLKTLRLIINREGSQPV